MSIDDNSENGISRDLEILTGFDEAAFKRGGKVSMRILYS